MSDGQDRIIARVRETLREAPEAVPDPRAVGTLLTAVWASPRPSAWRRFIEGFRFPVLSGLGASALAAVALLGGVVLGDSLGKRGASESREPMNLTGEFPVTPAAGIPVVQAAATAREGEPVLTQFVLDRADAKSVALVGDFNDWQADAAPLVRLESGLWTTSVPLAPGRHVYAFLVDGRLMVADPRAPKAGDADYGQESSVVMVFDR